MSRFRAWRPYVPVARRRANAAAYARELARKEKRALEPIMLTGRTITTTCWGQAWCDNLERYSDFENRLPRGRTYVRNGSVIDLQIKRGMVTALVSGSEIYHVKIAIGTISPPAWKRIKRDCAQSIASLIDLLRGRFDQGIMQRLTDAKGGLFPQPHEIKMQCSCPDWAVLCKHVAATLYGVGARLDVAPELLFTLRDVDHLELVGEAVDARNLAGALAPAIDATLAGQDLGEIFGIELEDAVSPTASRRRGTTDSAATPAAGEPDAESRPNARPVKKAAKRAMTKTTARAKPKALPKSIKRRTAKIAVGRRSASATESVVDAVRAVVTAKRAVPKSATAARRSTRKKRPAQ